ncbi:MAG: sugar ABC transporter permease [Lachnospiraceae bacterium]|nr:sugar ABC transporter permease [Lachnospiraceae bacterium]
MRLKSKKWMIILFTLPTMALFVLVYLAPMLIVFVTSFFDWKAGGIFKFVGLKNYILGFTSDSRMMRASLNTIIWTVLQAVVHVGIGTILAFILAEKFRGWKVFRTIFMIPNVISSAALAVIFLNVFNAKYGLVNSFVTAITGKNFTKNWFFDQNSAFPTVTGTWLLYTGMIVIIVLAGIFSIPEELYEAARIDGATNFVINMKIRLPLIRPVLGTAVIIAATSMLREFELIFLTTNGGPGDLTLNLPLYLYKTSLTENNYGYANMMGVILILAGVVVVWLINKMFRMDETDM